MLLALAAVLLSGATARPFQVICVIHDGHAWSLGWPLQPELSSRFPSWARVGIGA